MTFNILNWNMGGMSKSWPRPAKVMQGVEGRIQTQDQINGFQGLSDPGIGERN